MLSFKGCKPMESIPSFIYIGALFIAAYGIKAITQKLKIPEVTGYVVLGILLGQSVLRLYSPLILESLSALTSVSLGIIAFIIGIELRWDVIKKLGKSIFFIVICESIGTFLVVFATISLVFPGNQSLALLLAAVSSATAPAATVAVIKQYKAKGPLTSTILAVVGIDDAMALIIYAFVSAYVKSSLSGQHVELVHMILSTMALIGSALLVGLVLGLLYLLILRKVRNNDWIELLLAGFLVLALGLCEMFHLSELLAIMCFGAVISNGSSVLRKKSGQITEFFSPLFMPLFFILGGARLDITTLPVIGFMGLIYFIARSAGKIGGATLGATIGGAQKKVKKFIGFALLPQVGVALALALAVDQDFNIPRFGDTGVALATAVINILLLTTIATEIIGPLLTGLALKKSGERRS